MAVRLPFFFVVLLSITNVQIEGKKPNLSTLYLPFSGLIKDFNRSTYVVL
jgi:hypothetical protein